MSIESIAVLIGALGGFEFVKYLVGIYVNRRNNRRKENAEADMKEAEADALLVRTYEERLKAQAENYTNAIHTYEERIKAQAENHANTIHTYEERLTELRSSNSELNTQLLTCVKEKARKDEIIDDKIAEIRKVKEAHAKTTGELVNEVRRNGKLENEVQYYKNWKCFREYGKGKKECDRREPQQNPPLKYSPIEESV